MNDQTRVLLVDDDPYQLEILGGRLSGRCRLVTASSLAGAEDYLKTNPVDVILLDVGLPDSESDMLSVQRVKASEGAKRAAIVIVSGNNNPEFMMEAIRNSANGYIVKGSGDRTFDLINNECIKAMKNKMELLNHQTGQIPTL